MKVLVVDDDRFNLKVADGFLKMYFPGFSVELCQDPTDVIPILENTPVDIILLDIMMPEINGIQVLKEIRKRNEFDDIQIIMLTAVSDMNNFKNCFEEGANDYLTKPIDVVEFKVRINASAKNRMNILKLYDIIDHLKIQNDIFTDKLNIAEERLEEIGAFSSQHEELKQLFSECKKSLQGTNEKINAYKKE